MALAKTAFFLIANLVLFSLASSTCPIDTLQLGVCANLLNELAIGTTPDPSCCNLLGGLAGLDAALCLCTAIKAGVLGTNVNVPITLNLLLNYCGNHDVPMDFQCPE